MPRRSSVKLLASVLGVTIASSYTSATRQPHHLHLDVYVNAQDGGHALDSDNYRGREGGEGHGLHWAERVDSLHVGLDMAREHLAQNRAVESVESVESGASRTARVLLSPGVHTLFHEQTGRNRGLLVDSSLSGLHIQGYQPEPSVASKGQSRTPPQPQSWISGGQRVDEGCWEAEPDGATYSCVLTLADYTDDDDGGLGVQVLRVDDQMLLPARTPDAVEDAAGIDGKGRIPSESSFLYVNESMMLDDPSTNQSVWVFNAVTGLSDMSATLPSFMRDPSWGGAMVKMWPTVRGGEAVGRRWPSPILRADPRSTSPPRHDARPTPRDPRLPNPTPPSVSTTQIRRRLNRHRPGLPLELVE